jgi:hypothetical protein
MGFFGGMFGGSNPTLNKNIDQLGSVGSFLTNTGTKDVATSSNFLNTLLSGNSTNVAQLLAPQTEGVRNRAQQQKMQLGMSGTRGGGTTGAMLKADDDVHAQINDMIAKMTGGAVTELGSEGSGLISQGTSAMDEEAKLSQQRMENWRNSILGKGLSTAAQAAEAFGMGAAGGALPGGPGAAKGSQGALAAFLG